MATISILRRVNSSLQKSQRWAHSQRRKTESLWCILLLPVAGEKERLMRWRMKAMMKNEKQQRGGEESQECVGARRCDVFAVCDKSLLLSWVSRSGKQRKQSNKQENRKCRCHHLLSYCDDTVMMSTEQRCRCWVHGKWCMCVQIVESFFKCSESFFKCNEILVAVLLVTWLNIILP